MKRDITEASRKPNIQALINYLTENGVSNFNANLLLHTNNPALDDTSIMDKIREGQWERVWDYAELYVEGDILK